MDFASILVVFFDYSLYSHVFLSWFCFISVLFHRLVSLYTSVLFLLWTALHLCLSSHCVCPSFHPSVSLWLWGQTHYGCSSAGDQIVWKCARGLLGNADCESWPEELFCLLISRPPTNIPPLHMHSGRSQAAGSGLQAPVSASLSITPLHPALICTFEARGLPKRARYQLTCVVQPNRYYPSLFAVKLICSDTVSPITVTVHLWTVVGTAKFLWIHIYLFFWA